MSTTRRPSTRTPQQPVPHWTGILSRIVRDYDTLPTPTNVRIDATLLTGLFAPLEVSRSADKRLLILTTYDGAGYILRYGNRRPPVRQLFEDVVQRYQAWDTEGAEELTRVGRVWAFHHLRSLLN